jgi:hypothetical protein
MPEYLKAKQFTTDDILAELKFIKALWRLPKVKSTSPRFHPHQSQTISRRTGTPANWEESLMTAIMRNDNETSIPNVSSDQGIEVYRQLIEQIRAGMFASTLTLTFRYLLLTMGEEKMMTIARAFWKKAPPEQFPSDEAVNMAEFLMTSCPEVPHLADIMKYELANHKAQIENKAQTVMLNINPESVFPMLGRGQLPVEIEQGNYQVDISV